MDEEFPYICDQLSRKRAISTSKQNKCLRPVDVISKRHSLARIEAATRQRRMFPQRGVLNVGLPESKQPLGEDARALMC